MKVSCEICGRNHLCSLMSGAGISAQRASKIHVSCKSGESSMAAKNHLNCEFLVPKRYLAWIKAIMYIRIHEGWGFLRLF